MAAKLRTTTKLRIFKTVYLSKPLTMYKSSWATHRTFEVWRLSVTFLRLNSFCSNRWSTIWNTHSKDLSLWSFTATGSAILHSLPPKQLPLYHKESLYKLTQWCAEGIDLSSCFPLPIASKTGTGDVLSAQSIFTDYLKSKVSMFSVHRQTLYMRGFVTQLCMTEFNKLRYR